MSKLIDKLDAEIADKSNLDEEIILKNNRERASKSEERSSYFLGNYIKSFGYDYENPFVPFKVLDAQPFLTPRKLENLDLKHLLQYLFYRLNGGKNNPNNPFKEM